MNEERKENQGGNDESGITVRDIFRIIGKRIWIVLAGAVIVTLAAVLIFMFALNPAQRQQSMSFRIDYPMSSERKYPDGSVFDYRDIISRGVIAEAKNNAEYKEEFAAIDVDKIMKKDGITISVQQISKETDAPCIYTVSLKSDCFEGVKAEHFIKALTDAFVSGVIVSKAANLDYKLDKKVFEAASYKDQLAFLTEQKAVIVNQYSSWISEYKEGYRALGKSLGTHRTEAKTVFADKDKDSIENNLTMKGFEYFNGFVGKTEAEKDQEVKNRIIQLQAELKFVQAILADLGNYNAGVAGRSAITPYADDGTGSTDPGGNTTVIVGGNSELMSYIKRSQTIQQQITYLISETNLKNKSIENITEAEIEAADFASMVQKIEDFGAELLSQFGLLNKSADTLTDVIREIYENDTRIIFESNKATSEGGTSILIVGVAMFVVAFCVFAVIAYFTGRRGGKAKKTANAASDAETPLEKADDDKTD